MEKSGTVLYDEQETMIGVNILENSIFQSMTSLVAAAEKIINEDTGNTNYEYVNPYTREYLKMKAYWVTYTLGANDWKIIYSKKELMIDNIPKRTDKDHCKSTKTVPSIISKGGSKRVTSPLILRGNTRGINS
jgi:hypothetical protein